MCVPMVSTDLCEIWSKAFKILEPSFPQLDDREVGLRSTKSCGTSAYSGKHTYSRTPKQRLGFSGSGLEPGNLRVREISPGEHSYRVGY